MIQIVSTKCDHSAIAPDGFLLVHCTVVPQMTLHQPCLGVARIYVENSIQKNLCDLPSFFRDCACRVTTIDGYYSLISRWIDVDLRIENSKRFHTCLNN